MYRQSHCTSLITCIIKAHYKLQHCCVNSKSNSKKVKSSFDERWRLLLFRYVKCQFQSISVIHLGYLSRQYLSIDLCIQVRDKMLIIITDFKFWSGLSIYHVTLNGSKLRYLCFSFLLIIVNFIRILFKEYLFDRRKPSSSRVNRWYDPSMKGINHNLATILRQLARVQNLHQYIQSILTFHMNYWIILCCCARGASCYNENLLFLISQEKSGQ